MKLPVHIGFLVGALALAVGGDLAFAALDDCQESAGGCTGGSDGTPGSLACNGGCDCSNYVCQAITPKQLQDQYKTCGCHTDNITLRDISRACCHFGWKKDPQGNYTIPKCLGDCQSCPSPSGPDCKLNSMNENCGCYTPPYPP